MRLANPQIGRCRVCARTEIRRCRRFPSKQEITTVSGHDPVRLRLRRLHHAIDDDRATVTKRLLDRAHEFRNPIDHVRFHENDVVTGSERSPTRWATCASSGSAMYRSRFPNEP